MFFNHLVSNGIHHFYAGNKKYILILDMDFYEKIIKTEFMECGTMTDASKDIPEYIALYSAIMHKYNEIFNDYMAFPKMHYTGEDETLTKWLVFPANTSKERIYNILNEYGICTYEINEPNEWYDVPAGARWEEKPTLIKKGSRILFKQVIGLNI